MTFYHSMIRHILFSRHISHDSHTLLFRSSSHLSLGPTGAMTKSFEVRLSQLASAWSVLLIFGLGGNQERRFQIGREYGLLFHMGEGRAGKLVLSLD